MVSAFSIAAVVVAAGILLLFWKLKGYMVQGLVLANFGVFVVMLIAGQVVGAGFGSIGGTPLLEDLAFRPSDVAEGQWWAVFQVVTAAFLHADLLHILGNMLILLMIGIPFEERIGRVRFLGIYLFTAVTAVLLHVVYMRVVHGPESLSIPLVGASGAVFGILSAFAAMYPHDRVPMWLLFIILPRVPVVVAAIVLMLAEGLLLFGGAADGVARAAHLGGAVGGAAIGPLLKRGIEERTPAKQMQRLDVEALAARIRTPQQEAYLDRLRENMDEPDTARAWFDRLARTLECRECGKGFTQVDGLRARCPQGHEERYDRRA